MPIESVVGEVAEETSGRIDLFIRTLLPLSRSKLKGLFDHDCVRLNDLPCSDPATRVTTGDSVLVQYDPHQGYSQKKRAWSDRAFSIIHEDDSILVINKAAGVLTVPTRKHETNTLQERVTIYLSKRRKNHEPIVVHRLDRDSSGVMVICKTPEAASHLRPQFQTRDLVTKYVAIVHDKVHKEKGRFETVLDTHKNLNRFSNKAKKNGQLSVTGYQILKPLSDTTLIEIIPETFHRHQLRVHLFEAGHKILGDTRYGSEIEPHERWDRKRLALHCVSLEFNHPDTGETVTFTSDLPTPMRKFIRGG